MAIRPRPPRAGSRRDDSEAEPSPQGYRRIEPGIYLSGRYGARIEDIVVCTPDGGERLNRRARKLVVLDATS